MKKMERSSMTMKNFKLHISVVLFYLFSILPLYGIDNDNVKEFTLNNGLRVITYEMHTSPIIYSRLTYNIGSKYEPYGQTGISHIVEHMMFKGTKRFPKGTIAELISANGGVFNAFTSNDITVYYELLPKNKIDLAFDIESERMHKCKFDPEEFKSEIGVISEERKQRTDNSAAGQLREELNTMIYKSHPYRNPVIGWMHDIQSITRDEAYAYYKTHYTPNNATLVLVGDFESTEILKKVEKYFGKIPRGPETKLQEFVRVKQAGKKILEFKHPDILNEQISMHFSAPRRFDEDGAALYVAGRILCSKSATSRLKKRLVHQEKLCSSSVGGLGFRKDPGTFSISARLLPGKEINEVEEIIWEEIDSLANYPVIDYDLQKIKNKINFAELTGDQYISKVGGKIGLYENYVGWLNINRWNELVTAVTKEDIMRVTKKYLVPEKMVICYSSPDTSAGTDDKEIIADDSDEGEVNDKINESDEDALTPDIDFTETEKAKKGLLSKLFGSKKVDIRELYKPRLEDILAPNPIAPLIDSLVLDNGVPVYIYEDHTFPTVYVRAFIETGRLPENAERTGIRDFTEAMLTSGTLTRTYDELLEERSFTPYQFDISHSWDKIIFQGYSLVKDVDKMLNFTYDAIANPSFPEDQIEKLRPLFISNAENFKKTEIMKAFYAMFEDVFEGHQYSLPYAGNVEVFENSTRADLVEFHEKYYSPEHMKLVAVGDFDKQWIREKLNKTLGQWVKKSGDEFLPFTRIKPIKGKTVYVFPNPEYKQCRVDIAFNPNEGGIMSDNPDLDAIRILENILCGSSLTSRMGVELRDKQGLSYGIESNLWIRDQGGYWNIRTKLDKKNLTKMIHGIFNEIEKVQKEGITAEELNKAKSRRIALLPLATRTPDDVGHIVFNQLQKHRPLDYFDKKRERIMAVTMEDVQRVANKYLDVNNYIIAVSGNLAEDALDEFK
ncbi:insulinase family protein [bacterium]|nr:insulinase family protein [bacterium]